GRRSGERGIDLREERVAVRRRYRRLKGAGRDRQPGPGGPGHVDVSGAVHGNGATEAKNTAALECARDVGCVTEGRPGRVQLRDEVLGTGPRRGDGIGSRGEVAS